MNPKSAHRLDRAFALGAFGVLALLSGCGDQAAGDASDGQSPKIVFPSNECLQFDGGFPSGLVVLPGDGHEAAVGQLLPMAVLGLDLNHAVPKLLATSAVPSFPQAACARCGGLARVDSDGDGVADACRSDELGYRCLSPVAGDLMALSADRVALSTSGYEQVAFVDPRSNALLPVLLDPAAASATYRPSDWPFWPAAGDRPVRTAISTRVCLYGYDFVDSLGQPIDATRSCDQTNPGFSTNFTAGSALVDGRLFVATSNLLSSQNAQFAPGTLLVFEYDASQNPPVARPDPNIGVIRLSGYNPTAVTAYRTPAGRDFVLVSVTGAIALGTGSGLVRSESAIDVVDATRRTLVATIPLGRAGLGFTPLAIDATRRIALTGAATSRALFGIDLAALDDPGLGLGPEPLPIRLDGGAPPHPDARVFGAANPFALPLASDGPSPNVCTTQTSVALARDAAFGAASDFCDGTLSVLAVAPPASRTTPVDPQTVLRVDRVIRAATPLTPGSSNRLSAIDRIVIRPGQPGIDFDGPDAFFTAGLPEASVCSARINAL